jgi:CubicO group peptidase (beta-lactamase class C family)
MFVVLSLAAGRAPGAAPDRFREIPERMQRFVDDGQVAGAVTLVMREGRVLSLEAVGQADLASGRPMRTDSLFWVASMTKPLVAAAVLALQDDGKLSVQDPVARHLPEFKSQWMVQARGSNTLSLVRPPRAVTLFDLLTHSAGLGDVPAPRADCALAELVMAYAQAPLQFPPGSRWSYSNPGINTLGRVVEVVSGQPFPEFLERRFLRPLGMKDTTFWPDTRQARRLATSYQPGAGGKGLEPTGIFMLGGADVTARGRTPFPAGGLFSTAMDMANFYGMLLDGGRWRGKTLLSPGAVEQLTRTQSGDLKTGFTDGMSWGLGFAVVKEPRGVTGMLSPGTFGHGGAYGTQSWADPSRRAVYILMIQRARLPNADASPMRQAFQEAAVRALAE